MSEHVPSHVPRQVPLHVALPRALSFRELVNHAVVGIPRHEQGTVVLWLPLPDSRPDGQLDPTTAVERIAERARELEVVATRQWLSTPLVLALPAALGADGLAAARAAIAAAAPELAPRLATVAHGPGSPAEALRARERFDLSNDHQSWLLLVDAAGTAQPRS